MGRRGRPHHRNRVRGNAEPGEGSRILGFRRLKDAWFDDCIVRNGQDGFWIYESYRVRLHDCRFETLGWSGGTKGYPVDISNGTHHTYITDCESVDSERYGFKSGSGGMWLPCRNGRIENCHVEDATQRAYDQHQGSHYWEYVDCTAVGCGFGRDRSDGYYVQGGGYDGPGMLGYYGRQSDDARTVVTRQHFVNHDSNHVYQIYDSTSDGRTKEQVIFEDCWVEQDGSLNSFFRFRTAGDSTLGEWVADHVAVNDTWITEDNWEDHVQFHGDGDWTVGFAVFDSPDDGTTPSEYFTDEYGWTSGEL